MIYDNRGSGGRERVLSLVEGEGRKRARKA